MLKPGYVIISCDFQSILKLCAKCQNGQTISNKNFRYKNTLLVFGISCNHSNQVWDADNRAL